MNEKETIKPLVWVQVALSCLQLDLYDKTNKVELKTCNIASNKEIVKKEYYFNLTDLNS